MANIKLVQYADPDKNLHFVLYDDDTHAYTTLDEPGEHSERVQRWTAAGNTVEEYAPLISGGIIPLASITWFCATTPPEGYLLCDGSEVSRARYANLFRAIGTIYGSGDGGTTFNLPNLVGRFCRGWGPVSPLDPTRQFGSYQEDEVKKHSHTVDPASHTHLYTDPGHNHELVDPGHIHDIQDPGHQHGVTDPGHQHLVTELSHMGYAGNFLPVFAEQALAVTPPYSGQEDGNFSLSAAQNLSGFEPKVAPANLQLTDALSNVMDEPTVTNVTVDVHGVDIPYTELAGDFETRPDNIALLPVIRY
jgi:microcystin-dependent protein